MERHIQPFCMADARGPLNIILWADLDISLSRIDTLYHAKYNGTDHLLVRLISGLISLFFFIAALASLLSGSDALMRFLGRILGSIDSIEIN